jgi:hypothetical protein
MASQLSIAVCMWYDDKIKDYAELSRKINDYYCDLHGYDFIVSHKQHFTDRHPAWERLPLLLELTNDKYDYIVYIDADACFRIDNLHEPNLLEDVIMNHYKCDIIFTGDPVFKLCTGLLIIKNTQRSIDFIQAVIDEPSMKDKYYKRCWDQDSTIHCYNENKCNIQNNSVIVPFGILQTFNNNIDFRSSLIIHFEQRDTATRIRELRKLSPYI